MTTASDDIWIPDALVQYDTPIEASSSSGNASTTLAGTARIPEAEQILNAMLPPR